MTPPTFFSEKITQLHDLYQAQTCTQCELMNKYVEKEYKTLQNHFDNWERLVSSNPNLQFKKIREVKRSLAILGLYITV